jgi:hypothetical protein
MANWAWSPVLALYAGLFKSIGNLPESPRRNDSSLVLGCDVENFDESNRRLRQLKPQVALLECQLVILLHVPKAREQGGA